LEARHKLLSVSTSLNLQAFPHTLVWGMRNRLETFKYLEAGFGTELFIQTHMFFFCT